ncbi:MAG: carboxypeptidase regulatory-like domain-containing protein [Elusimicrobia bacterium]|nr:carboxypeptidase regulatory-like domain-containing protein [Elusimicrobiota bacterium]
MKHLIALVAALAAAPAFAGESPLGGLMQQAAAERLPSVAPVGLVQVVEPPKPVDNAFSHFTPRSISLKRDGGTIVLIGSLNRSVEATIRADGRINSPTRGQIFVTRKHWRQPAGPEHRMTPEDLAGLSHAVRRHLANVPNDRDRHAYQQLLERLTAAGHLRPVLVTGIRGHVSIGPNCGGPSRPDRPCPDKPHAATIVISQEGKEIARVRSNAQGVFEVGLPPGRYRVEGVSGNPFPHGGSATVEVAAGRVTRVEIKFDTGIR